MVRLLLGLLFFFFSLWGFFSFPPPFFFIFWTEGLGLGTEEFSLAVERCAHKITCYTCHLQVIEET